MGALSVAMILYDGEAHGVIDLSRSLDSVQVAVMPYLMELFFAYMDEVFSYISMACNNQVGKIEDLEASVSVNSSNLSEIKEQFTCVGGVAVKFCVHIKRTDILFEDIFSKFISVHHRVFHIHVLHDFNWNQSHPVHMHMNSFSCNPPSAWAHENHFYREIWIPILWYGRFLTCNLCWALEFTRCSHYLKCMSRRS